MIKKALPTLIKLIITLAVIYFVARSVPLKPAEIGHYFLHTGVLFYTSLLVFTIFLMIQASIWLFILNDSEKHLSLGKGLLIFTNTLFGKYIPGGFWNYAGRIVLASREGVPLRDQLSAMFYENVLLMMAAAIYAMTLFTDLNIIPFSVAVAALLLLVLFFAGYNYVSVKLYASAVWLVRKLPLRRSKDMQLPELSLSRNHFFLYLGYYLASHLLMGVSFWLLLRSFGILQVSVLYAAGTYAAAWLLGSITPLPGGLGVREGFLVYFLKFRTDTETAVQISIIARIWNVASELLFLLVMNLVHQLQRRFRRRETSQT